MAITYTEFDSTNQNLIVDLRAAILTNTDWSFQGYSTALATTTVATLAAGVTLTFTSGTIPAAIIVGSTIRIGTYGSGVTEYRNVTAKTATTITVAAMTNAHPIGTDIFWGQEVFKTTTVRGADFYLDLTGATFPTLNRIALATYNGYTSPTGSADGIIAGTATNRYLYWRRTGGTVSQVVHVILSSSEDHFFVSIEGPRASETGPVSATFGSPRNYFFMSDLVPYSVGDTTPVVVVGGGFLSDVSSQTTIANALAVRPYIVNTSKNVTNTGSWVEGKLVTLQVPDMNMSAMIGAQRYTVLDSEYYLAPYVLASDEAGLRGRLAGFFFAGFNTATNLDGVYPMVGSQVTYNGVTYEFQAVSKGAGDGASDCGPLGLASGLTTAFYLSPVVAIPVA